MPTTYRQITPPAVPTNATTRPGNKMYDLTGDEFEEITTIDSRDLPVTPQHTHHGGGPNTPTRKSRSRRNGLKHGCRSHILILDNERQEDFDALYQRWEDVYQPDTEAALELLEQFVVNNWYLERNERRFNQVESQLSEFEYTKWNDQQHKIYQLTQRYKTAAERAASKARHELETFLKDRRSDEKYHQKLTRDHRATLKDGEKSMLRREASMQKSITHAESSGLDMSAQKSELADIKKQNRTTLDKMHAEISTLGTHEISVDFLLRGQNSPKRLSRLACLEQQIEIKIHDGLTLTELTPANETLIARGQSMFPSPEIIYRHLHFPNGIPAEYAWTTEDPLLKQYGGFATQRMSLDTWLNVLDSERLRTDGHIGPVQDQPDCCECPACDLNHERLAHHVPEQPQP